MTSLGTKLAKLRKEKKLTQLQLAEELQISQNAYNKWESDKTKPSVENLVKLASFYDTNIYDLLDEKVCFNLTNPVFNDCSAVQNNNPIYNNNQPSEILEKVLTAHEDIIKLIEAQNNLIMELLKKQL